MKNTMKKIMNKVMNKGDKEEKLANLDATDNTDLNSASDTHEIDLGTWTVRKTYEIDPDFWTIKDTYKIDPDFLEKFPKGVDPKSLKG